MSIFDLVGTILGGREDKKAEIRQNARSLESSQLDYERSKEFAQNQIQWRTEDAQEAGVHPLFAMGASTTSFQPGGSSGYRETGSVAGNTIRRLTGQISNMQKDFMLAQIENTKAKTTQILANANQDNVVPKIDARVQQVEKARVQPYKKDYPEQNLSVLSPMTKFRIGSQKVFLPVEEMDQVMEDPLKVAVAAYNYRGNKNVNWRRLIEEYTGKPMGTALSKRNPAASKAGREFARMIQRIRIKNKGSRREKVQRTFFRKTPRQTRGY